MDHKLPENPFKFPNDVLPFIPKNYRPEDNLSWFATTPTYRSVRVNTLKSTATEVIHLVKEELSVGNDGNNKTFKIFQHETLKDCVLVKASEQPSKEIKINPEDHEIIVGVSCGNAVLRGAHIFAPEILAMESAINEGANVNIYVDIDGKCSRGYSKKFNGEKVYIGKGIVLMNPHKLFKTGSQPCGVAVEVKARVSSTASFSIPIDYGILQNLPSMLTSVVLNPTCDNIVLHMCCSSGNKTSHIATLMENKGILFALDKSTRKIDRLKTLCMMFGIKNVRAFVWDSVRAVIPANLTDGLSPPFPKETFDRILLDGPCSSLGQRPNLRNNISLKQLKSYPPLQKRLFSNAVDLLSPGGILVYCTCTVTIEENEGIVRWALDKFPCLKLCRATPYLGLPGLPECGLSEEERNCVQRFGAPIGASPETDTIGFFLAKFMKLREH